MKQILCFCWKRSGNNINTDVQVTDKPNNESIRTNGDSISNNPLELSTIESRPQKLNKSRTMSLSSLQSSISFYSVRSFVSSDNDKDFYSICSDDSVNVPKDLGENP
ncbi:hypothetical protein FQA39_LY07032 [Lamprigera yunnana]|nr:hypothetical protein FQA39_LY07032 [Lamprigera yunnana]